MDPHPPPPPPPLPPQRPPPPRRRSCPACIFQRSRCDPDCIFAQYFNDRRTCFNIHRLFGYRRVERLIQQLPPEWREDAAKSISFEAEMRRRFPVDGCSAVQNQLQHQITQTRTELAAVRGQIEELQLQQYLNSLPIQHALPNTLTYAGNEHMHGASTNQATSSMQDWNTNLNHEEFQTVPHNNINGGH